MAKVPPEQPPPPKPTRARRPKKAVADQVASVTDIRKAKGTPRADHNPLTPRNLQIAERRNRAYNLRRAGLTFQQIADQLGPMYKLSNYTRQRAQEDCMAMRDGIAIQPAKDALYDDLDRINALLTAVWKGAMDGDTKSVSEARRLLDQRAKYLGLYSPVRHVLTGEDGGPIQIQDLADPAAAYAAALGALDEHLPAASQLELPGSS